MKVGTALNRALFRALDEDARVLLLGEDIADPYGGAFKITRGLSSAFSDRVRSTPVSEAAIVGVAAGLAMAGHRPIVEIMFSDFVSLAFDQIVNHVAKYQAMYDGQVRCPVIVRFPSGGHRGYGPTHSQSLEKHLMGVPHLRVVGLSAFVPPDEILFHLLSRDEPAVLVEHKLLYGHDLQLPEGGRVGHLEARIEKTGTGLAVVALSAVPAEECHATLVAYGYLAATSTALIEELAIEEEIFIDLVVPTDLCWRKGGSTERAIRGSVARTGRLVTAEEGTEGLSWGTEIAHRIATSCFSALKTAPVVVASTPTIIPSDRTREREVLTGPEHVRRALRAVVTQSARP